MRLPNYLTTLSPVGQTLSALETETHILEAEVAVHNAQLCPATADTGLTLWERDYALAPDGVLTARRARVRAALMGHPTTLTRDNLAALAVTVGGADAGRVEEDAAAHRAVLYALFYGRKVEDVSALREAVERLRPAHLTVEVLPVLVIPGALKACSTAIGKAHLVMRSQPAN